MKTNFKAFLRMVLVTKSWIRASLVYLGFMHGAPIHFRNGSSFALTHENWVYFMSRVNLLREVPSAKIEGDIVQLNYGGRKLFFNFGKWGPAVVCEVFGSSALYDRYLAPADLRGKIVVDIGAAMGDSVVYFALHGAKKVYAYEPFPSFCDLAIENVKLNHMENICEVFNAGVAKESGVFADDKTAEQLFGSMVGEARERGNIPNYSLRDIVQKFNIGKGAFLKVDCEGYEYDILMHTPDDILKHFDHILIEYHYGLQELIPKLKNAGFRTINTEPIHSHVGDRTTANKDMYVGHITARLM